MRKRNGICSKLHICILEFLWVYSFNFKTCYMTPRNVSLIHIFLVKFHCSSVWDSGIIERAIRLYHNSSQYSFRSYIENSLLTQDNIELWSACPLNVGGVGSKACTSEWAQESFRDALMYAYGDENGKEVKDGAHLSEEYFETRLEVVQLRLAAGGVRLAATLEDIFGIRGEESQVA
jgi:hypothetical protein